MLLFDHNLRPDRIPPAARRGITCCAVMLILLGCSMSDAAQAPKEAPARSAAPQTPMLDTSAVVEADVFSGRPNPSWSLSEEDTEQLRALVAALPPSNAVALPDPLGYRGMLVRLPSPTSDAGTTTLRVWRGVVQQQQGAAASFFSDADRKVEAWLLQRGQPQIEPEVFRVIQSDFAAARP